MLCMEYFSQINLSLYIFYDTFKLIINSYSLHIFFVLLLITYGS